MIYIQNSSGETLGVIGDFYNDTHQVLLSSGVSSYTFTVSKQNADPKENEAVQNLQNGNMVLFNDNQGKSWFMYIQNVTDTQTERTVYCEDLGMQLIDNVLDAFSMPSNPHSFAWYFSLFAQPYGWHINHNEMTDTSLALAFDQQETVFSRLTELATDFNCELEFFPVLTNENVTDKQVNVYKQRGAVRNDLQFEYGNNVSEIQREVNNENIVTALIPQGNDIAQSQASAAQSAQDANTVVVKYKAGYGVDAYDDNGKVIAGSNKKYLDGTSWTLNSFGWPLKDTLCVKLDNGDWIPVKYTNHASIKINYVTGYGVNALKTNGTMIYGSNAKYKTGTTWTVLNIKDINNTRAYFIGDNAYIPVQYTQFGDGNGTIPKLNISDIVYDDGTYYTTKGDIRIYNRDANRLYNNDGVPIDNYFSVDTSDVQDLFNQGLAELKLESQPAITYTMSLMNVPVSLGIGDTVRFIDHTYNPELLVDARVSELDISYADPSSNTAVFSNFVAQKSNINDSLTALEKKIAQASDGLNNVQNQLSDTDGLAQAITGSDTFVQWQANNVDIKANQTDLDSTNGQVNGLNQTVTNQSTQINTAQQTANRASNAAQAAQSTANSANGVAQQVKTYFDFESDGLNIGKSDSPMQVNLSNDQLSFKNSGVTVAYINGQKLYITDAQILDSITVGHHRISKLDDDDETTIITYTG